MNYFFLCFLTKTSSALCPGDLRFPKTSLGGENLGGPGWEWVLRLAQGEVKWGNWENLASEAEGKDMWGLHR